MIDHRDRWFGLLINLHCNRKRFGGDVVRSVGYRHCEFAIKLLNDRPGSIGWTLTVDLVNWSGVPDCVNLGEFEVVAMLLDAISTGVGVGYAVQRLVDVSQKMNQETNSFGGVNWPRFLLVLRFYAMSFIF